MRFLRSGLSTTEPGALFAFRRLSLRESASTAARRALVACRAAALTLCAAHALDSADRQLQREARVLKKASLQHMFSCLLSPLTLSYPLPLARCRARPAGGIGAPLRTPADQAVSLRAYHASWLRPCLCFGAQTLRRAPCRARRAGGGGARCASPPAGAGSAARAPPGTPPCAARAAAACPAVRSPAPAPPAHAPRRAETFCCKPGYTHAAMRSETGMPW